MWDAVSGGNQIQSVVLQQSGGAPTNQLQSVTTSGVTKNYSYDAAGNVTNDGVHSYTYDGENRLMSVDGGATAQYAYDQNNRRYKKTVGSAATHYVWEGSQVVAEHEGSTGAVIGDYVYSGSRMVTKVSGGTTQYFLSDRLSARLVIDTSGNALGRESHLPFGEDFGESGTQEKHHFTSYERDAEAGTDYAVNRRYAQDVGRFMTVDPVSGSKRNPQSLNRYAYVLNEPVGKIDALGLCPPQLCPKGQIWSSDRCKCVDSSDRDPGSDDEEPVDRSGDLPSNRGSWDPFLIVEEPTRETPPLLPAEPRKKAEFSLKKLQDCASQIFGAEIMSFDTGGGFARVWGPDTVSNLGNNAYYSVTFDFTHTGKQLGKMSGRGGWLYGGWGSRSPYLAFIASDIAAHTHNSNPILSIAAQVHELGNALQKIGGVKHSGADPPDSFGDTDPGVLLERCVFGGMVADDGTVIPPK